MPPTRDDIVDMGPQRFVARHEPVADAIFAGRWQLDALIGHLLAEESVGDLHQHARAVAHQRIRSDSAAMRQVFEHEQPVLDDLVRLDALHLRDEADAAGVMLVTRVVKAARGWQATEVRAIFDGSAFGLSGRRKYRCLRWRHVRHRPFLHKLPSRAAKPPRACPKGITFQRHIRNPAISPSGAPIARTLASSLGPFRAKGRMAHKCNLTQPTHSE
jgi:hypothetical protein